MNWVLAKVMLSFKRYKTLCSQISTIWIVMVNLCTNMTRRWKLTHWSCQLRTKLLFLLIGLFLLLTWEKKLRRWSGTVREIQRSSRSLSLGGLKCSALRILLKKRRSKIWKRKVQGLPQGLQLHYLSKLRNFTKD